MSSSDPIVVTSLRELDALVHRRVFEIEWDESRCRICGWAIVPDGESGCWADNCSMRPAPKHRADEPPAYTADANAMLEGLSVSLEVTE